MKVFWNVYTKIIIGVLLFGLIAAGGINYYTKVQSDARYFKVVDGVLGYTAEQVDVKARKPYEKLIRAFGDANDKPIFPMMTVGVFGSAYTMVNGSVIGTYFMVEDTCIIDRVGVYISNDATYTTNPDTTVTFNGFVLCSVNKSTGAETIITKTKNTPTFWDAGTAGLHKTLDLNTEQTLIPDNIYWLKAYYVSETESTVPTILSFGTSTTRNIYGYFFTGLDAGETLPLAKTNPTDYVGLSTVPGLIMYVKP